MPVLLSHSTNRRTFLRLAGLGTTALVVGCRSMRQVPRTQAAFRVALLSDTHVPGDRVNGHRGFNPWKNLERVAGEVVDMTPDAVVLSGDAARLVGTEADYQELKSLLAPVAVKSPVFIGLGNHDDRGNFRKIFQPAAPMAAAAGDHHVVVVEHDVVRIIVLDSLLQPNLTPGFLGTAQREWLGSYLSQHRDRPAVVVVHHTLQDRDGDLLDADRLFKVLKPHRHVKAVFYGHSHVWELRRQDRLHLVNLPAVGYNFDDLQPVGWVQAQFDDRGVALELRAIGGNLQVHGQRHQLRWS